MALQKARNGAAVPFKFVQAGDTLKGYYQGQVKKEINGSMAIEHTYKTAQGLLSVLGQANILRQYENEGVLPGTYVEITFTGETKKAKKGMMKVYDVNFDLDDRDDNPIAPLSDEEAAPAEEDEDEAEEELDEVIPAKPVAPRAPSQTPDAARQAKVQALLNKNRPRT